MNSIEELELARSINEAESCTDVDFLMIISLNKVVG